MMTQSKAPAEQGKQPYVVEKHSEYPRNLDAQTTLDTAVRPLYDITTFLVKREIRKFEICKYNLELP